MINDKDLRKLMVKPKAKLPKYRNCCGIIGNVGVNPNIPLMPRRKNVMPRRNMSQKEFLRRTAGNMLARITDHDKGGVISGMDCRPFNRRKHNDLETAVETEEDEAKLKAKLKKEIMEDVKELEAQQAERDSQQAKMDSQKEPVKVKKPQLVTYGSDGYETDLATAKYEKDILEKARTKEKERKILVREEIEGRTTKKLSEDLTPKERIQALEAESRRQREIEHFEELKRKGTLGEQRAKIRKLRYEGEAKLAKYRDKNPRQPLLRPKTSMSVLTTKGAPPASYMFDTRGSRFDFSDITGVRPATEGGYPPTQSRGINLSGFLINRPSMQTQPRAPVMSPTKKKMKPRSLSGFMDYKKKKKKLRLF